MSLRLMIETRRNEMLRWLLERLTATDEDASPASRKLLDDILLDENTDTGDGSGVMPYSIIRRPFFVQRGIQ